MKRRLPNIIPMSTSIDKKDLGEKRQKVTLNSPIEEWNTLTFAKYFEYLYQIKFSMPYILNKADLAQMKRILQVKDKEIIKVYMENFIELDYFPAKTLRIFCSSYTQTSLDKYLMEGKLPYEKDRPKELEDWSMQLRDVFGGDNDDSL